MTPEKHLKCSQDLYELAIALVKRVPPLHCWHMAFVVHLIPLLRATENISNLIWKKCENRLLGIFEKNCSLEWNINSNF